MPVQYITVGAIVLAFVLAAFAVRLAHGALHRVLDRTEGNSAVNRAALHQRAKKLIRSVMLLAFGVAALASISLVLSWLGVGGFESDPRLLGRWLVTHGVNVLLIIVGATFVMRASNLAIEWLQHRLSAGRSQSDLEWQRRASTVRGILTHLVTAAVGFVALLMLLRELSIDVLPILTTAGVAGLAIGFGAQNLVRDVISGFFVILEDQVRVGDLARINAVTGTVEEIKLRTIVLRDSDAAVHVFPNGTITALANLSKGYSNAIVDVRIAYTENLDRVFGSIREVGASLEQDSKWGLLVIGPIEIVGVESIDGGFATVRMKFKTLPLNQARIANELRRRVMTTFAGRGIRPYAG
jgi:small-conductance mechanosensitive channel